MKSSKFFLYLLLPLIVFSIIILSAFGRTLSSYFLEDDFGEVLYVSRIFSGHWHKVITNLTGNYMEIPTMKVYRPCLLLSIMADYAFWRTDATGYFITNILFLIGSAVMLYQVLLELTKSWYHPRALTFALFSAALFAASPLHCESVSLMVGRVDIICAFFYLLSLWCFVYKGNSHNWIVTTTGVIAFWIAMLTKEMAIGLPVLLSVICLLFSDSVFKQLKTGGIFATEKYQKTIGQRIGLAFNISYPLWLSCLFYFIIRYFALGTILGGYVGSVGASQVSHILEKWKDPETVARIIVPLSKAVFHEHSSYHILLFGTYFLLLILIVTKLIVSGSSRKWLLLLAVWTATVLAPIYQLWGLGVNLEGARFLFFLTIPLAVILPLLIFSPQQIRQVSDQPNHKNPSDISPLEIKMLIPSAIVLSLLVILDTKIAAKNNIPWVHAGKQTRALLEQGQRLALSIAPDKKAILLGLPKEIDGAHIIYNGATFNFIMAPPFSKNYYADRFITFEPIFFGNPDLINPSRLKKELLRTDVADSFVWRKDKLIFEKLPLLAPKHSAIDAPALTVKLPTQNQILFPYTPKRGWWQPNQDSLHIQHCESGTGLLAGPLNIDPYLYDFMEIEAAGNPPLHEDQVAVFWSSQGENSNEPASWEQGAVALPANPLVVSNDQEIKAPPQDTVSAEFKTYRIPLSRYWQWFTNGAISNMRLEFPAAKSIFVRNIRLLPDSSLVPKLSVAELQPDNRGVYQIDKKGVRLEIDASQIKNISAIKLEFSKPNYFFENFDSNSEQAVLAGININELKSRFLLNPNFFSNPGYYQIRAIGLSNEGHVEGEWSDPLTLKF